MFSRYFQMCFFCFVTSVQVRSLPQEKPDSLQIIQQYSMSFLNKTKQNIVFYYCNLLKHLAQSKQNVLKLSTAVAFPTKPRLIQLCSQKGRILLSTSQVRYQSRRTVLLTFIVIHRGLCKSLSTGAVLVLSIKVVYRNSREKRPVGRSSNLTQPNFPPTCGY